MTNRRFQQQFGSRVRSLRKMRGLSQEELSEAIDKSVDTVSNIERGALATRLSTVQKIATALRVEVRELFEFGPGETRAGTSPNELIGELLELVSPLEPKAQRAILSIARVVVELSPPQKPSRRPGR